MTKDHYFEMCEMLGSEPIESEIPIELSDLPHDVQYIHNLYSMFKDEWDHMNGNYLGKNFSGIKDILELMLIPNEDFKFTFDILVMIDRARSAVLRESKPKHTKNP